MKNLESKIEKNLDKIMLGTIGAGVMGEALYYAITGDTLPDGVATGFYRGFLEVGPAYVLVGSKVGTKLLQYFMRNRAENNV